MRPKPCVKLSLSGPLSAVAVAKAELEDVAKEASRKLSLLTTPVVVCCVLCPSCVRYIKHLAHRPSHAEEQAPDQAASKLIQETARMATTTTSGRD